MLVLWVSLIDSDGAVGAGHPRAKVVEQAGNRGRPA